MSNTVQVNQSDIEKFRIGILVQGNDYSVEDYYSKLERCNEVVQFNEDQLRYEFIRGLTPENKMCVANVISSLALDELVGLLIHEEKEREEEIERASILKDYLSQPDNPIIDTGSGLSIITEDEDFLLSHDA